MNSGRLCCFIFAVSALFAVLSAQPAHAQFGSGIVYDPTQSAHAIRQILQGEQQLEKWATELENWKQQVISVLFIY